MRKKRASIVFLATPLAVFGVMLLGGCTPVDPAALETFVVDLLRNAGAALLL